MADDDGVLDEDVLETLRGAEGFLLVAVYAEDAVTVHFGPSSDPDPSMVALLTVTGQHALEGLEGMVIEEARDRGELDEQDEPRGVDEDPPPNRGID